MLKLHFSGPLTLGHCLVLGDQLAGSDREWFERLVDYLYRLARWQIDRLNRCGKPLLLFVDEPALVLSYPLAWQIDGLKRLVASLRRSSCQVGIYCSARQQISQTWRRWSRIGYPSTHTPGWKHSLAHER